MNLVSGILGAREKNDEKIYADSNLGAFAETIAAHVALA